MIFVKCFCLYSLECRVVLYDEFVRSWTERSCRRRGYGVFLGGGVGWGIAVANALHKRKSWGLFSRCQCTSKAQVQRILQNVMDYPLTKEYPTFYGAHRFMIVCTGSCPFSTHWSRRTQSVSSFFKMRLNVTSHLRQILPSGLFPSRFSYHNSCVLCSYIPCMLHAALISFSFI